MKFLNVSSAANNVEEFNQAVKKGDTVFAIFHRDGCPPCMQTLPEWKKIKSEMGHKHDKRNDIVIADVNSDVMNKTTFEKHVEGFPTIVHISNNGHKLEPIENAKLINPSRSVDGFIEWIELKTPGYYSDGSKGTHSHKKYRTTPHPHSRRHTRTHNKRYAIRGGRKRNKKTKRLGQRKNKK